MSADIFERIQASGLINATTVNSVLLEGEPSFLFRNSRHKPPEEGGDGKGKGKESKKGRRKSMPTMNEGRVEPYDRRASVDFPPNYSHTAKPEQPALQAQSMYPHHPLLTNTPATLTTPWTSSFPPAGVEGQPPTNVLPSYSMPTTVLPAPSGHSPATGQLPYNPLYAVGDGYNPGFSATPMRLTGSDQSLGSSGMGRGYSGTGYEFGYKKRACDQCNHSKVKCTCEEPCARCTQRKMTCTYNKPPKSRSFAMLNGRLTTSGSTTSSPSSHYSSPYSNPSTSPVNDVLPGPNPQRRSASMSDHIDATRHQTYMGNAAMTWGPATFPPPTPQSSIPNEHWQKQNAQAFNMMAPPAPMAPRGSLPSNFGTLQASANTPSKTSSVSPQMHLAPTPSLTSLTASPSGSDELPERRTSQTQVPMPAQVSWQNSKGLDPSHQFSFDPTYTLTDYSPTSNFATATIPPDSSVLPSFSWKPEHTMPIPTIDPRLQLRDPLASDDDTSGPVSARASVGRSDAGDQLNAAHLQDRRRSSTSSGIWANAFDQMSLQDSAAIAMAAATLAGTDMSNPFNASQIAQTFRRPSFPLVPGSEHGESRMPSSNDVKDLWRMFMAPTPNANGDRPNPLEANGGLTHTPRPPFGRSLSKSNSMPDLTSPSLLATQQNYHLNVTPRADQLQSSYAPPHDPSVKPSEDDGVVLHTWKSQIQQRQASFSMSMVPNAKMDKAAAPLEPNNNRPLPSVLQSSALQQTLAPERAPSFGIGNFDAQSTPPGNLGNFTRAPSKLSRPGNKRLASQTLGPEDAKAQRSDLAWSQEPMGSNQSFSSGGNSALYTGDASASKAMAAPSWMNWAPTAPGGVAIPAGVGDGSLPARGAQA
ncbi:hypothetical protein BCR39DRAFT_520803 [Naematelia encephala]|uniref:Zn(2)-C6 fungal-type domain-containing protein n=1 Tax=Naematelia encephala TaxID=71784 RepID=A0A1Y2BDW9_9TREE|nr:hypothetical protein BCR39DRAFT_520803 [Naematelia encephala]